MEYNTMEIKSNTYEGKKMIGLGRKWAGTKLNWDLGATQKRAVDIREE